MFHSVSFSHIFSSSLKLPMAYQSTRVGAIETEDLDRRLGVDSFGLCETAHGGVGEARSCRAGAAGGDSTGEHLVGSAVKGRWEGGGGVCLRAMASSFGGRKAAEPGKSS